MGGVTLLAGPGSAGVTVHPPLPAPPGVAVPHTLNKGNFYVHTKAGVVTASATSSRGTPEPTPYLHIVGILAPLHHKDLSVDKNVGGPSGGTSTCTPRLSTGEVGIHATPTTPLTTRTTSAIECLPPVLSGRYGKKVH